MAGRRRLATALLGAAAALVLAAAPWGVGANGFSTHALAAPAGAGGASSGNSGKGAGNGNSGIGKSGNAGNSGKSSSGRDSSGKGGSGKGAGNGNSDIGNAGNSGKGNAGKANSGSASPGNAGPGSGDPAAGQRAGGAAARFGSDFGSAANEHVNPVTGTMIEINGSNVEVLHRDGFREEIVDGRYSMNDAQGRLIVERSATESDRARFRAMLRF